MGRRSRFTPPHCPNPHCHFHQTPRGWRYRRFGFYARQAAPRRVQRYRCSHCHRTFSSQTFAVNYWLKRPRALGSVYEGLLACSGFRQIARALEISSEELYVRAGILDERDDRPDVVAEIRRDPILAEDQKKTLIHIYESFRGEVDESVPALEAVETDGADATDGAA